MEAWRPAVDEGLALFQQKEYEQALGKFLSVRHMLAPPGVDVHIFLCMKELKLYAEMTPFLEATLQFAPNDRNAELWRMLGLLYLHNERDVDRACIAWKRAVELNPFLLEQYQGLQIIHLYDTMKKMGGKPVIDFVDLETGDFSIQFSM